MVSNEGHYNPKDLNTPIKSPPYAPQPDQMRIESLSPIFSMLALHVYTFFRSIPPLTRRFLLLQLRSRSSSSPRQIKDLIAPFPHKWPKSGLEPRDQCRGGGKTNSRGR